MLKTGLRAYGQKILSTVKNIVFVLFIAQWFPDIILIVFDSMGYVLDVANKLFPIAREAILSLTEKKW